jgi:trypsin
MSAFVYLLLSIACLAVTAAEKVEQLMSPHIINGEPATPGKYPFFASSTLASGYLCSAALVAPDLLISAAHCSPAFPSSAIVNVTIPHSTENGGLMRSVVKTIQHEEYDYWYIENDIMLIKISPPIYSIEPIVVNFDPSIPADGANLTSIGFGRTETFELADELMQVTLVKVADLLCLETYEMINQDRVMCAANHDPFRGSCFGK